MTAVRLARGATGRAKILKFAGCYHGHLDALLVAAGSGVATLGLPGFGRRHRGRGRRHRRRAVQRRRRARRRVRGATATTSRRCSSSRSPRTWASSRPARLPRRPAPALHRARRAPRARRGDHRVPGRARRRAGPLRHHARPLDLRQGHRRRPPARRGRRPRRRDGRARAARPRVPGGHAVGEPARHRRRARRAVAARRRRLRRARAAACTRASPTACAARSPPPGSTAQVAHVPARSAGCSSPTSAGARLRRRQAGRPRARTRASSTRMLDRGVFLAAERLRGDVREPRPRRRRARPHVELAADAAAEVGRARAR